MRRPARALPAVLVALVTLAGCGEPPIDVAIPQRQPGEHVVDQAGVFSATEDRDLHERLAGLAESGPDIVALTFETEAANCGEAYRAAKHFVALWKADIAVVAVAAPGDFASTASGRKRCLGVQPLDDRAVPAALREEIAEELVPPKAADNDWAGAFEVAVDALVEQ